MFPLDSKVSKEWHTSVTVDLRINLIQKLVMGMQQPNIPISQDNLLLLIKNAQVIEKEMYEEADTRSEYYHLLAQKIYLIQRELELERLNASNDMDAASTSHFSSSQHMSRYVPMINAKKQEITEELRTKYASKFKEDLKPSTHLDIPMDVAMKAENICFERASSLNDYYKYTAEVYKVKEALSLMGGRAENQVSSQSSDASTSQSDQMESKFADAAAHVWNGETPDEEFTREMAQLLMAIEKHSLGE